MAALSGGPASGSGAVKPNQRAAASAASDTDAAAATDGAVGYGDMSEAAWAFVLARIQTRRPDLDAIFAAVAESEASASASLQSASASSSSTSTGHSAEDAVAVLACGPDALVDGVSDLCFAHRFAFHSERFAY
jgi:hypothetical protein